MTRNETTTSVAPDRRDTAGAPADREPARLLGADSPFRCGTFSRCGRFFVAGACDGTVRSWDLLSGRPYRVLTGHAGAVESLALVGDGELLASGSRDGTIRLWDLPSGRCHTVLQGHNFPVLAVAARPDGEALASADVEGTIKLWNLHPARPGTVLKGAAEPILGLSFSPGGDRLLSGHATGTIRSWSVREEGCTAVLEAHPGGLCAWANDPCGRIAASGGMEGWIRIWHLEEGRILRTLQIGRRPIVGLACNGHDEVPFAFDDGGRLLRAANARSPKRQGAPRIPPIREGASVGVAVGGGMLAVAGPDPVVRLWLCSDDCISA